MTIREATMADYPQLDIIRNSVKENVLSNPHLVTKAHYREFLEDRGKGWVGETNGIITGFAVIDLKDDNVWALFIHPDHERKGIGRKLHDVMMNWYFSQGKSGAWLSTTPGTRADRFYRKAGWTETGTYGKDEIKFEMTAGQWQEIRSHV